MQIHDVIDYVTRSQSTSNFEINISPSMFVLERRSQAQNVGNANGYLSGIFHFRYNFRQKVYRELKMAAILKTSKFLTHLQFDLRYETIVPNDAKKGFFMVMTSSMTSQGGFKVSFIFRFRRGWLREQVARAMSCQ